MVRGAPDPGRARAGRPHRLQVLPGDREHRGDPLTALLGALRTAPVPHDLTAWADAIAGRSDDQERGAELLGAGRRAGVYASVLWNAARLVRFRGPQDPPSLAEALLLLAATCGASSNRLDAAVSAGLAEERMPSPSAVAETTTWVLPAAACAYVSTHQPDADATAAMDAGLRDVAAALLVVRAPVGSGPTTEPPGEGLLLGHALAAGWLAVELWSAGVVGAPETYERTVAAVAGAS